jgi:hypothetical protein
MAPETHPGDYADADRFHDGKTGEPLTPEQEAEQRRRLTSWPAEQAADDA